MTERTAYSLPEVRAALGISRSTMWRWIESGKLPVIKICGRAFVKRESLNGLLDQKPIPVSTPVPEWDPVKRNGN